MAILETINLKKNFGALQAIMDINLSVEENKIHSIIGPNGAGKTTLFNTIAGVYAPTSGKIYFQGADITHLKVYERSRKGIGRSHQLISIFPELTVVENLRLAVQSRGNKNFTIFRNANNLKDIEDRATNVLEEMGLSKIAYHKAGAISYGYQRSLEVGVALATNPTLLLLDEPTSGLPPDDARRTMDLIKKISKGLTVLLVEHHMTVVMSISDIITVLHQGNVIAEGNPKEIQEDEKVKRAYLGGYKHVTS